MAPMDEEEDELELDEADADSVALRPGPNADKQADVEKYIDQAVRERYEVHSYRHAASILASSFPEQLNEIQESLRRFSLTTREIGMPGGNESEMPKKFSKILRPRWVETRIQADLIVHARRSTEDIGDQGLLTKRKLKDEPPVNVINYIDGHKIDYVCGRVAFDFEWNSKDQTFDRDLYALRTFHECGLISVGVIVTRGQTLTPVFDKIPKLRKDGTVVMQDGQPVPCKGKYGASTTWMGKLLYRLNAGRHGGCPIVVFGMTPRVISDWVQNQ